MQLSPRQYQVDPTGAAYVQDTRPLMAAMGAQAATQIEGNRMMQETMQKGMQGVENFAARRQLAAARAQLGTLDPEAENYGQQLSGLILDNPLAFTNPKTAPIANMAFKQASDENQAKLARKYKLEDMATQFGYQKQLAAMRIREQSAAYRLTPEQKFMSSQEGMFIREELSNINRQETSLRQSMVGKSKAAQREGARQLSEFSKKRDGLLARSQAVAASLSQDTDIDSTLNSDNFTVAPTGSAAPLPPASAQTVTGGAGNGPELPMGEANVSDVSPSLFFTDADGAPFESADMPVAPVTQAAVAVEMPTRRAEPVLPEAPIPNPPLDMFARDQYSEPVYPLRPPVLSDEQKQAAQQKSDAEAFRREVNWENTPSPVKQQVVTNYVAQDPVIQSMEENLLKLENEAKLKEEILKTARSKSAGAVPEEINAALSSYAQADLNYSKEKGDVDVAKGQLTLELLQSNDPSSLIETRIQDRVEGGVRKSQMNAALLAKQREIELAAARRKTAGDASKTSTPQGELDALLGGKKDAASRVVQETDQQWTDAKQKVTESIGGEKTLAKIAFDTFERDYGSDILLPSGAENVTRKLRLENEIRKALADKGLTGDAFSQKAERFGSQNVSWDDVISSLADELLVKYTGARNQANIPAGQPINQPVRPALGNTNVIPR